MKIPLHMSICQYHVGNALPFMNTDAMHAKHRRLLTPVFHFGMLKNYGKFFNEGAKDLIKFCENEIEKSADGSFVTDMFSVARAVALDNLMKCCFGRQTQAIFGEKVDFADNIHSLVSLMDTRIKKPWLLNASLFSLSDTGREARVLRQKVEEYCKKLIAEREAKQGDNPQMYVAGTKGLYHRKCDFMDMLLTSVDENGLPLSEKEIIDETAGFLFAGHDTTAATFTWLVYNLANNPEWQTKCRQEIDEIFGDKETVEVDTLKHYPLVNQTINESARIKTTVGGSGRVLKDEFKLTEDITLPKGTWISASLHGVHQHPKIWKDPYKFDPTRFSPENKAARHPFSFVPFSGGERNCLGKKFAEHEDLILIIHLLKHFEIEPVKHDLDEVYRVVRESRSGVPVRIRPRRK
eukprot:m.96007 g.96007  ORF g.96007 m.96007 type:complete len:408 (-) comp21956_c0_seq1:145-1368(-)